MSIEKDIHMTKSFRSEHHKAMVNIQFTSNWIIERVKSFVENANITPQQYNILRILRGSIVPLSTLQIRERMLDKMSDTSRLVDRLVKKGLAEKKVSATDKRLVDVTITENGIEVLERLDENNEQLDSIAQSLTTEEAAVMNGLLDKLRHK